MKIEPVAKQYRDIAKANFLTIPPFQRPFSWTPDNIEEFWDDLINIDGSDYFLGSVVFFRDKKDKSAFFVTDGQQRITTINIVLAALRDICLELGLDSISNGIQGFIQKKDEDDKDRFVLKYSNENKYFQSEILSIKKSDLSPESSEEKNQKQAYEYFSKRISSFLQNKIGNSWKSSNKTEGEVKKLRDAVIDMQFVVLTLESEDEAFVIFETLNTRGKDLAASDLVKNHLAKNIKSPTKDVSIVSTRWGQITKRFDSIPSPVDFDTFLTHYWLAKEKYVSKKKVFSELKANTPKAKAEARLIELEEYSKSYVKIANPSQSFWTDKEFLSVRRSIAAINLFSVAQARPLLLALVRAFDEKRMSLKQLRRVVGLIENFTFQFNAVTQSRGGGGIAGMYASLAQQISKCVDQQACAKALKEVETKFRERDINFDEFDLNFSNLTYHKKYTRERALIRYILGKFRRFYAPNKSEDFEDFTIEHLVPQASAKTELELDKIGKLENLILVPSKLNEKLGKKSFKKKIEILEMEGFADKSFYFQDALFDDPVALTLRAETMAQTAFNEIWKV